MEHVRASGPVVGAVAGALVASVLAGVLVGRGLHEAAAVEDAPLRVATAELTSESGRVSVVVDASPSPAPSTATPSSAAAATPGAVTFVDDVEQRELITRLSTARDEAEAFAKTITVVKLPRVRTVTKAPESMTGHRALGYKLMIKAGFKAKQWHALDELWGRESSWRVEARNPESSATGIPQALAGQHDLPENFDKSARVQIRWGLDYIERRYQTPEKALKFHDENGWY